MLPNSTSLTSASVASTFLLPTLAVSIPLKGRPKRASLTQPASPTWQSYIPKSQAVMMYAADDAAITRSSISASVSSLQLPLSLHSIDIPESPLPPAEQDEAARSDQYHIDVDPAGMGAAASGGIQGAGQQQQRRLRQPPSRRSPRAWLLLWLVTVPTVMLSVTCGLIFYHSIVLYASFYIAYLVFLPTSPLPLPFQLTTILFIFAVIGRSLFNLLLAFTRVRHRQLWVNQRRHRQPFAIRQLHLINCLVTAAVMLSLPPALTTMVINSNRSWDDPLVYVLLALMAIECIAWLSTIGILAALKRDFRWAELSLHCPFIPISSTFNSTALQRRTVEQNRRAIDALPVHRFSLTEWREQRQQRQRKLSGASNTATAAAVDEEEEVCCAICLADLVDGDAMRVLKCRHCFHQACIDRWLEFKTQCPMCIRQIDVSLTSAGARQKNRVRQRTPVNRAAGVVPLPAPEVELAEV